MSGLAAHDLAERLLLAALLTPRLAQQLALQPAPLRRRERQQVDAELGRLVLGDERFERLREPGQRVRIDARLQQRVTTVAREDQLGAGDVGLGAVPCGRGVRGGRRAGRGRARFGWACRGGRGQLAQLDAAVVADADLKRAAGVSGQLDAVAQPPVRIVVEPDPHRVRALSQQPARRAPRGGQRRGEREHRSDLRRERVRRHQLQPHPVRERTALQHTTDEEHRDEARDQHTGEHGHERRASKLDRCVQHLPSHRIDHDQPDHGRHRDPGHHVLRFSRSQRPTSASRIYASDLRPPRSPTPPTIRTPPTETTRER